MTSPSPSPLHTMHRQRLGPLLLVLVATVLATASLPGTTSALHFPPDSNSTAPNVLPYDCDAVMTRQTLMIMAANATTNSTGGNATTLQQLWDQITNTTGAMLPGDSCDGNITELFDRNSTAYVNGTVVEAFGCNGTVIPLNISWAVNFTVFNVNNTWYTAVVCQDPRPPPHNNITDCSALLLPALQV